MTTQTAPRQREIIKAWYRANKEKHRESNRQYYQNNKEKILSKAKDYKQLHKKQIAVYLKEYNLKLKYNLTLKQYTQMLETQNYKCASCFILLKGSNKNQRPHVDHNHTTGKVRGILCNNCNLTIGHARESVELLQKITTYLKKYQISEDLPACP